VVEPGLVERVIRSRLLAPKGSRVAGWRVVEVQPEQVLCGFDLSPHVSQPVTYSLSLIHYPRRASSVDAPRQHGGGRRAIANHLVSQDHARRTAPGVLSQRVRLRVRIQDREGDTTTRVDALIDEIASMRL